MEPSGKFFNDFLYFLLLFLTILLVFYYLTHHLIVHLRYYRNCCHCFLVLASLITTFRFSTNSSFVWAFSKYMV